MIAHKFKLHLFIFWPNLLDCITQIYNMSCPAYILEGNMPIIECAEANHFHDKNKNIQKFYVNLTVKILCFLSWFGHPHVNMYKRVKIKITAAV